MKSLFFWNDWKKPYKYLYLFLILIFTLALSLYLVSYFIGIDAVISWELRSIFDSIKVPVDQFSKNLIDYSVDVNNYLIREKYFGSSIKITPLYAYIYFSFLMIGILVALTVITKLDLPGFTFGMSLFIFFIFYLHTELIEIFGSTSRKFALFAILLYGGICFYFQAYDKRFNFIQRLLIYIGLTIILALLISFGAKTQYPFFYLANYGLVIPVILSLVFIVSISYDIILGFLFLTSGTRAGGKNMLLHFSIITSLFLANLVLIYLKKKGILTLDFVYLDVFVIYIVSVIVGLWGLKSRAPLFKNIMSISHASFLYIALAIISTATIAYTFITGNDPLSETFQYAILYSHLGMGIVFFLYIIYNFWELFYKNMPAYELVYQPRRMPYFMVRPLGLIIMLSLFMQSGMYPYKLAKGGYFNAIGDIYLHEGKLKEAKEAYSEGSIYGIMNRRSNYCMGLLLTQLSEKEQATEYYLKSLEKYPSEFAYINISNIYVEDDQFFKALFTLKDGLEKFPHSGALHNNLAFLYSSKGIWDSTYMHLEEAKKYLKDDQAISANYLWFLARKELFTEADSIFKNKNFEQYLPFQTNKIAIANLSKQKFNGTLNKEFIKDSILNGDAYCYLFNYGINHSNTSNKEILNKIDEYLKYESNIDYHEDLRFLKCLSFYYSGNRAKAIQELKDLTQKASSTTALYYYRIMGLWAMEQEAYLLAAENFKQAAMNMMDSEAQLNKALALLEAGSVHEALEIINQLKNSPDKIIKKICGDIIQIFSVKDFSEVNKWSEAARFQFMHFQKSELTEPALMQVFQTFTSEQFKILGAAEMMKYFLDNKNIEKAENIYQTISNGKNQIQGKDFYNGELNYQYLRLLEAKQDWKNLSDQAKNTFLNSSLNPTRYYFLAIAGENSGNGMQAEKDYLNAIEGSPYFANAFIKAAEYYNKKGNSDKAYEILVKGITFNETSTKLLFAYAIQCLKMNLTNYAEDTMEKIKELTSSEEFSAIKKIYDREKAIAEKKFMEY